MLTVTGLQIYRWRMMGITDIEDLQWLLSFYCKIEMSCAIIQFNLTENIRWHQTAPATAWRRKAVGQRKE